MRKCPYFAYVDSSNTSSSPRLRARGNTACSCLEAQAAPQSVRRSSSVATQELKHIAGAVVVELVSYRYL
ncbi:hypothetical protein GJ744_002108 [Endocarpon pusillum]|uniref:Uncharacterized protein n=1 Tax=Endocarpon pusillum TaxID=364733 RepID=A0A8H7E069_9EURO|nr:hypothetical protein GJ744_002108 [Endocarpon pusillum]